MAPILSIAPNVLAGAFAVAFPTSGMQARAVQLQDAPAPMPSGIAQSLYP